MVFVGSIGRKGTCVCAYMLLLLLLHAVTVRGNAFNIWTSERQMHSNCTKFNGCLTMMDRMNYLNPNATSIPCGFLAPSGLDKVRDYFTNDHKCEVVIYSLIFQAYNIIYNPISYHNYLKLKKYSHVCFYLFVDKSTVLNGQSLKHISNGGENEKDTKFKLNSQIFGGHAWQVILLEDMPYSSFAHSMKAIKLLGWRLFPNAKMLIWFDPKYVLKRTVTKFVSELTTSMNGTADLGSNNVSGDKSIAISEHFFHDILSGFQGARDRLIRQNLTYKHNVNIVSELEEISRQKATYEKDGLFSRTKGNNQLVVDSAVMFYRNNEYSQRYFCAWANEVSMFSRRDQLSEYAVREKLGIQIFKIAQSRILHYFRKIGHQRPKSTVPQFNEMATPPRNIHFHEAGTVPLYSAKKIQYSPGSGDVEPNVAGKSSTIKKPRSAKGGHSPISFDDGNDDIAMQHYWSKAKERLQLSAAGKSSARFSRNRGPDMGIHKHNTI